jgi:hypothetical protein
MSLLKCSCVTAYPIALRSFVFQTAVHVLCDLSTESIELIVLQMLQRVHCWQCFARACFVGTAQKTPIVPVLAICEYRKYFLETARACIWGSLRY